MTTKQQIKDKIIKESVRQGVDPDLMLRLAKQESGYNQNARSPVGAIGVMQLMPGTAKGLKVDPYDVDQNIKGGVTYLKRQINRFGSTEKALAAYNAGPGAVSKYNGVPPYKETQNYVRRIMGGKRQYQSKLNSAKGGVNQNKPTLPPPIKKPSRTPFDLTNWMFDDTPSSTKNKTKENKSSLPPVETGSAMPTETSGQGVNGTLPQLPNEDTTTDSFIETMMQSTDTALPRERFEYTKSRDASRDALDAAKFDFMQSMGLRREQRMLDAMNQRQQLGQQRFDYMKSRDADRFDYMKSRDADKLDYMKEKDAKRESRLDKALDARLSLDERRQQAYEDAQKINGLRQF